MSNSFITVKEIARMTLPRLIENLVFPNLVHKDFSNDFVKGKGAKIQVKKPVILEAKDFNESTGTEVQSVNEESVEVTLDKLATVDVEFSALESATNVDDLTRLFLEPAAVALAQKINSDGLELYKDIPYFVGSAGSTPDGLDDFANARKMLNINKVPVAGRKAIWDPNADAAFTQIPAIVNAEKSGSTSALREGSIGRVLGFDNYMSQSIKTHASGTAISSSITLAVDGAATKGSNTIHIDGGTGTETLLKGDLLQIGKFTYTVTADTTFASGEADVPVYPSVQAAHANDTKVTGISSYVANLAFNPLAFAYVTRPLTTPSGVESYVTSYNGISLRVVKGYDMKYKKDMLSMDVLYGYKTMYPELATLILG